MRTNRDFYTPSSYPMGTPNYSFRQPSRSTSTSNDDCPLQVLLTTKAGWNYVFWDSERSRLLIKHGDQITVIYFDKIDVKSCQQRISLYGGEEQYIYCNGRPVASYFPRLNTIVIKRDGEVFAFDNPVPPIGYNVRTTLDIYVEMAAAIKDSYGW